jgi:hypothetical protein
MTVPVAANKMLSLTPPRVPPIIWKNCGIGYIKKDFFNK